MDYGRPRAEDSEGRKAGISEDLRLQAGIRSGKLAVSEPALMSVYNSHSIMTVEGDVVLLKFVESIRVRDNDDLVVDKLKGDVVLSARTTSGKEHTVSMNALWESIGGGSLYGKDLAEAVCEKWHWINKP